MLCCKSLWNHCKIIHNVLRTTSLNPTPSQFAGLLSRTNYSTLFKVKTNSILLRGYNKELSSMSNSEDKKAELKKRLTPLQYHITQEKGTERAFTGKFNKNSEAGTYSCVVCDQPLFSSQTKFDSGCGWPAFNDVLDQGRVKLSKDTSNVGANLLLLIANPGMVRTEVQCATCSAHLGHVFGDGPPPTRKRFCINSEAMQFHPADETQEAT